MGWIFDLGIKIRQAKHAQSPKKKKGSWKNNNKIAYINIEKTILKDSYYQSARLAVKPNNDASLDTKIEKKANEKSL